MSRISIAVAIFVSAAVLEVGGALVLGRVETVRVASPTRINLEEPVRVASPARINLEEPIRVASPTRINLEEP